MLTLCGHKQLAKRTGLSSTPNNNESGWVIQSEINKEERFLYKDVSPSDTRRSTEGGREREREREREMKERSLLTIK
jgi:hypothetical protein